MASKDEIFNSIYQAYANDVFKTSLKYLQDEDAARDITQKTFFQFYQHMDNTNIQFVRAYLVRSARNLSLNYIRDSKHVQSEDDVCVLEEKSATVASLEDSYIEDERRRKQRELSEMILERLRQENELWYEAINLVCCLEKPQDEVARELGISKDVLYSRLHRARKWIHKNYNKEFEEFVDKLK